ncbi:MAG TPA: hypothetical protein VMT11_20520 [Myxococcaceae bacterium]|nr:hypothetical protein [Myxococcaceae bacterium]
MPRRPSTEEWIALLSEFEQSGLQQKEFCAKHDLSIAAFQYWYYRKAKKHSESAAKLSESFLPIEVVGSAAPSARPAGAVVEIALAGGIVVRLPAGTEPRYVSELLRALR